MVWSGALAWATPLSRFYVRSQKVLFFSVERYDQMFAKFRDHARTVVLVSQTIPTVRIFIALPAGILGMSFRMYLAMTFIGCLLWNGSLILGGVLVQFSDLPDSVVITALIFGILAVEFLILWGITARRKGRKPQIQPSRL